MILFAVYNSVEYMLSLNPSFPLKEEKEDNVVRSPFEGGYEQTRPRFTRNRKTFTLQYKLLQDSDKTTLENLYDATKGADRFTWYHPVTNHAHIVRFAKPLAFEYVLDGYWTVQVELREV